MTRTLISRTPRALASLALVSSSLLTLASCANEAERRAAHDTVSVTLREKPTSESDPLRQEAVHATTSGQPETAPGAAPGVAAPSTAGAAHPDEPAVLEAVSAVYAVISGPAGQDRDWDKMRSMFVDGARLIPIIKSGETGETRTLVWSVEDYITRAGPGLVTNGFTESSIHNKVDIYGNIAHVFSTYEGYVAGQETPFVRGINSFQLAKEDGAWKVVTIFWQAESPELPIPAAYLP